MEDNPHIRDVIVIGGGPAGLTAAIYLARFRRRCLVLSDGESRARWIPTSHNIPGFLAGIGGSAFLNTLTKQALNYGSQILQAHVASLTLTNGIFHLDTDHETFRSRYVLLATGVKDHLPAIAGATEAVLRSLLRFCPICDGFEAIGMRIAVVGDGPRGEREAAFLRHYSDRITLLQIHSPTSADRDDTLAADGLTRLSIDLADLHIERDKVRLRGVRGPLEFDAVYVALGCTVQHELARSLNAACDAHGALKVNHHQETSVRGLYAAGDVVRGLNQVVVAAAEGAIAATDIHNQLRDARS